MNDFSLRKYVVCEVGVVSAAISQFKNLAKPRKLRANKSFTALASWATPAPA
jgi:hypothetical protein